MGTERQKITFPYWGNYTLVFQKLMDKLGVECIVPEETNQEAVNKGVKFSPELFCFPLKVNIGNYLSAIEKGANTILIWENIGGICRFRYYWLVQEKILKEAGYNIKMVNLNSRNLFSRIKELSPQPVSFLKFLKIILLFSRELNFIEKLEEKFCYFKSREKNKGETEKILKETLGRFKKINGFRELFRLRKETWQKFSQMEIEPEKEVLKIGLVGEIYTISDGKVNFELEKKLAEMGVQVHRQLNLTRHLLSGLFWIEKNLAKKANIYLKTEVGGHGREAVAEMLDYAEKGFDGVIQLLPFGCFVKDTNITVEGYLQKPIKEIKAGEKVLTHKGRFKKVTQTFCRNYQGKILKVDCGGKLLTFSLTSEHPILLAKTFTRGSRKKEIQNLDFVSANKTKKGDFIAIPIPKEIKKIDYFEWGKKYEREPKWEDIKRFSYLPELLRMLGYWLAEGTIRYDSGTNKKYKRGIAFHFASQEKDYIDDVAGIIKNNFESKISQYNRPDRPDIMELYIGNRNLGEIIFSLCGEHCDKKILHNDLMALAPELQREILKGFFRGDGSFRDEYGETTYRGVTTSPNLASQLFWLLIRNRIKPSLMEQHIKNRKLSYMLKIATAGEIKRLGDKKIKVTDRKKFIKHRELENYFLLPIRKIETVDFKGEVYNLEVEDDHSYVANFMAVHNCMPEVTVRPILQKISQEKKIPFLSISLDEQTAETGLQTRLEAFVDLMKSKKGLTKSLFS